MGGPVVVAEGGNNDPNGNSNTILAGQGNDAKASSGGSEGGGSVGAIVGAVLVYRQQGESGRDSAAAKKVDGSGFGEVNAEEVDDIEISLHGSPGSGNKESLESSV